MDGDDADRFEAFVDALAEVVGHADRVRPLRDYCMGLLTPAERKSVEPLAAVTGPSRVPCLPPGPLLGAGSSDGIGCALALNASARNTATATTFIYDLV